MRNRNLWILAGVIGFIAAAAALGFFFSGSAARPDADAPSLMAEASPITVKTPDAEDAQQAASASPTVEIHGEIISGSEISGEPQAYLMVTVGSVTYQPLALTAEGEYTITQKDSGAVNVIHVTPQGVSMTSSTCKNQDCVKQGEVTLGNRETRLLSNMIICLPNRVTLELCTPEELDSSLQIQ